MSYIKSTLLREESPAYYTRPHWILFAPAVITAIASLLVLLYGGDLPLLHTPFGHTPLYKPLKNHVVSSGLYFTPLYKVIASVIFIIAIFVCLSELVTFYGTEYAVTNMRIILKHGLILRHARELFLEKVEAIDVDQTMLGRLLNYGSVTLVGTGGSHDETLAIPRPLKFRHIAQQQVGSSEISQK